MSRRRLAGVIRRMTNTRQKARKAAFPPYLAQREPGGNLPPFTKGGLGGFPQRPRHPQPPIADGLVSARVGRMSRRRLAGVIRRMTNTRRKARKAAFPPYLAGRGVQTRDISAFCRDFLQWFFRPPERTINDLAIFQRFSPARGAGKDAKPCIPPIVLTLQSVDIFYTCEISRTWLAPYSGRVDC